jgi:hypothetical protein
MDPEGWGGGRIGPPTGPRTLVTPTSDTLRGEVSRAACDPFPRRFGHVHLWW